MLLHRVPGILKGAIQGYFLHCQRVLSQRENEQVVFSYKVLQQYIFTAYQLGLPGGQIHSIILIFEMIVPFILLQLLNHPGQGNFQIV